LRNAIKIRRNVLTLRHAKANGTDIDIKKIMDFAELALKITF
jgi:hypothetical protein